MPVHRQSALLLLSLLASCHTGLAQINPPREFARALLLQPSKTIWIYGGMTTYNAPQAQWDILTELDVSVSWSIDNPPYTDHTSDGAGVSPDTIYGTFFPTADQKGFFALDAYGPNGFYGFAKYNTTTHLWTTYPTTGVLPNAGPAVFDASGNTWVWGGISASTGNTFDPKDIFRWDPVSQLWSRSTPPVISTQRSWHTANLLPTGVMVIIGGMNQLYNGTAWNNYWALMNDISIYDTSSGVWRESSTLGSTPQSRILHTTVLAQDGYSLIVYGGSAPAAVNGVIPSLRTNPDSEITLNDVQVLDTRTYTWSAPTIHGVAQSPRYAHTAVQVGGLMIVMGGSIGQNYSANLVNDTQVLDTTQWTWLSTYTPPTNWTSPFSASVVSSTVMTTSTPTSVISSTPIQSSAASSIGIGAIVGIAVGAVVVILAAVILFIRYNRSSRAKTAQNQGPPQYDSPAQLYGVPPQPGTQPGQPYGIQPGLPHGMQFAQQPMHGGQGPSPIPPHQSFHGFPQTGYLYGTDPAAHVAPLAPKDANMIDLSSNQYSQAVPPPWRPSKMDQDPAKVGVITVDVSKPDDAEAEESDIQYRY